GPRDLISGKFNLWGIHPTVHRLWFSNTLKRLSRCTEYTTLGHRMHNTRWSMVGIRVHVVLTMNTYPEQTPARSCHLKLGSLGHYGTTAAGGPKGLGDLYDHQNSRVDSRNPPVFQASSQHSRLGAPAPRRRARRARWAYSIVGSHAPPGVRPALRPRCRP